MPVVSSAWSSGPESRSDPNRDPDHARSGRRHWSGEVQRPTSAGANSTKRARKRSLTFEPNLRDQEAAGSSPATPTTFLLKTAIFSGFQFIFMTFSLLLFSAFQLDHINDHRQKKTATVWEQGV